MALPKFTLTGNLNDILPGVTLGEVPTGVWDHARILLSDNLDDGVLVWQGKVYNRPPSQILSSDTAGNISAVLLGNDAGLNVTGIQWHVRIESPRGTKVTEFWIGADRCAAGATVDLATVIPAPGAAAVPVPQVIKWYDTASGFPGAGVTDGVYGARDTGLFSRWNGTAYVQAGGGSGGGGTGGPLGPNSVTLANLVAGVQATLAKADSALQSVPANSVGSGQITDGAVVLADLAAAVQASLAKADTALQTIATNAIGSSQIADGTVSLADLTTALQNSVALANTALQTIAAGSVGSTQLTDGGVALVDLASGVQASLALATTALQSVPTNSVGTAQIADGTVGMVDLTTALQAAIALAGTAVQPAALQSALDTLKVGLSRVALFGDSITVPNQATNSFAVAAGLDGYWTWAGIRLRQRLTLTGVFGYTGKRIDEISTNAATVLATNPDTVFVLAGTNSVTQGRTLAQMTTDMTALFAPLKAARVRIIVGTVPPLAAWSTPQQLIAYGFNRWLIEYGSRNGIVVVDWSAPLADPTTGLPATGVLADGTHPAALGAAKMGKRIADAVAPLVPAVDMLSAGGDPGNLVVNGSMVAGSPIATAWTAYDTAFANSGARAGMVPTKVARTDDVNGFWQQFVLTDTAGLYFVGNDVTTGWAVGNTLAPMLVEFERGDDWTAMSSDTSPFRISLQCVNGGLTAYGANNTAGQAFPTALLPMSGVVATPRMVIPAGTTAIRAIVEFNGKGTLRLGRIDARLAAI